jgi:hypothetical protein
MSRSIFVALPVISVLYWRQVSTWPMGFSSQISANVHRLDAGRQSRVNQNQNQFYSRRVDVKKLKQLLATIGDREATKHSVSSQVKFLFCLIVERRLKQRVRKSRREGTGHTVAEVSSEQLLVKTSQIESNYRYSICFTICLFISPDLDGHSAPKNGSLTLRDPEQISKPKYEATVLHSHTGTQRE